MKNFIIVIIFITILISCNKQYQPEKFAERYCDEMLACAQKVDYEKAEKISGKFLEKLNEFEYNDYIRVCTTLDKLVKTPKYEIIIGFMKLADYHRHMKNILQVYDYIQMGEEISNGGTILTYTQKKKEEEERKRQEMIQKSDKAKEKYYQEMINKSPQ